MDPSGVLLTLEEQKKWRERQLRIQERIRQLDRRKSYLLRELDHARKKVADLQGFVLELRGSFVTRSAPSPPQIHAR
ncbi:MAG: hypothetical protein A3K68_06995 [Euryarchaeota archaeon RBG_16_68_13]|nr:MAG: hypothetical protein A3K68_06995 [Euryarchaeota archaeon RBG_16_68_13]